MYTQFSIHMRNTAFQVTLMTEVVKCDVKACHNPLISACIAHYILVHLYTHIVHCNTIIGQKLMLTSAS